MFFVDKWEHIFTIKDRTKIQTLEEKDKGHKSLCVVKGVK